MVMATEAKWQADLRELRVRLKRLDENTPTGPPPTTRSRRELARTLDKRQHRQQEERDQAFDEEPTQH
jgi:hypothetical protein